MSSKSTLLLEHHLKELRLPTFLREYHKLAAQCAQEGTDHPDYLLRLAELELIDRHQRMVQRRMRAARFPAVKSLDTFDFLAIPSVNKPLVMELARCEYIERRENVIALGNSGTGKTHIALGTSASSAGPGRLPEGHVRGLHHRRGPGPPTHGGQGRTPPAQPPAATGPAQAAHHRRTGTNWASSPCPPPARNSSSRSSASATNGAPSWSPPTCPLTSGPMSSGPSDSPEHCWTA